MSLADKIVLPPSRDWHPRPELLMMPNIPKPMSGVCPRVVLGSEWWDRVRYEAYTSTGYHCAACGVYKYQAIEKQILEGHEVFVINYRRALMMYMETVPLCHYCHNFIHDGRMAAMVMQGLMTAEKRQYVLEHGRKVLKVAKLRRPDPYEGVFPAWRKWRMVCFGKKYPPLYKTEQEWHKAFGRL